MKSSAFPSPNTTPLSQYTHCDIDIKNAPDARTKRKFNVNNKFTQWTNTTSGIHRNVHDQGIQSSNRKPLLELTYHDIDQISYKYA
ncbi:hypothetical protein DEO72_LG7g1569 [Vigna unguiculata]|uniref:Uncharacterized protein n=1 Tax=Vigna unguiculata TaxID=3917 RepID=A0A4D6MFR8_VIGUN|nr:hypothetical protein DEO72_LG7g1569 [Vigna unguiculata]